jgi:glycosyltransferase involved in cell wall biosynthesis
MKISIALCTYNGEAFLPEQLESIENQTRRPDEMIVCDDGSSDGTWDILQAFKKNSCFPVQIFRNEKTLGSTKNFEKTILLCNGDIIALSDQDDVWKQHKLEIMEGVFGREPSSGYVFSDAEVVDEDLNPLEYGLWEAAGFQGPLFMMFSKGQQTLCFLRMRFVTGAAMAFRASLRNLVIPFPVNTVWVHDNWIAACLSSNGAFGVPISEKLFLYRQHLKQQIGISSSNHARTYFEEYSFFSRKKERLWEQWLQMGESCLYLKQHLEANQNAYPDTFESIKLLDQFERHFENRKLIHSTKGFYRLKVILEEIVSGRYRLFSNSWKSVIRDMFL